MARPKTDIEPRIVAAARKHFLASGVDAASLRRIAKDAGTSLGMIYYYFRTKDELFFAVVQDAYAKILVDLEDALAATRPVEERLRGLYRRFGSASPEEMEIIELVAREALASPARLAPLIAMVQRGHVPLVVRAIQDGIRSGLFEGSKPHLVLLVSTVSLGGFGQFVLHKAKQRLPAGALPDGTELSDELFSVLLSGIRTKTKSE